MKLCEKIRIIRKARGYSQEELGYNLQKINAEGISRQTVSDWENGKSEPKLNNIRDLVEVLDVSFDALLDESIDLNDKNTLNAVLKHLSNDTKERINNSFRYHIYAYTVKPKDYARVIVYFGIMLLGLIAGIVGLCLIKKTNLGIFIAYLGGLLFLTTLASISLPISWIKTIKKGGRYSSFGTLSQTHFVIIGWSDMHYDRTIYVPVSQIESMELAKDATKRHGVVLVHIKDRTRPLVTNDIVNPQKLIYVFNNLDSFVDTPNIKEGE